MHHRGIGQRRDRVTQEVSGPSLVVIGDRPADVRVCRDDFGDDKNKHENKHENENALEQAVFDVLSEL